MRRACLGFRAVCTTARVWIPWLHAQLRARCSFGASTGAVLTVLSCRADQGESRRCACTCTTPPCCDQYRVARDAMSLGITVSHGCAGLCVPVNRRFRWALLVVPPALSGPSVSLTSRAPQYTHPLRAGHSDLDTKSSSRPVTTTTSSEGQAGTASQ